MITALKSIYEICLLFVFLCSVYQTPFVLLLGCFLLKQKAASLVVLSGEGGRVLFALWDRYCCFMSFFLHTVCQDYPIYSRTMSY